jgi:G:T-mismatch repair DNA endonuclease (very short patch repair protein)
MSALTQTGWKVLVLWECQIQNRAKLKYRLLRFLGAKWTEIR